MKKKIAFTPVLVFVLLVLSTCAALAAGFLWNHPLETELEINGANREKYQVTNLLASPELAETHGGITVSTDQCVVDEHTAYISFRISGWSLAAGEEPGFDMVEYTLEGLDGNCSISSGFVSIWSEKKQEEQFADDDGTLAYEIFISTLDDSLIGRKIHVALGNPGVFRKDKSLIIDVMAHETWTFDWELNGSAESVQWEAVDQPIGETEWTLSAFTLTPVTAIVSLTPPASFQYSGLDEDEIPFFVGVTMADGDERMLSGMGCGGMGEGSYREVVSLNHIIDDLENVREVLFATGDSNQVIHVQLSSNLNAAE